MAWADIAEADLNEMIGDMDNAFRSTLVWAGQTAYGSATDLDDRVAAQMAGFQDESDCEWIGAVSSFAGNTPPDKRATVTVGGVTMVVLTRLLSQDGISVTLRLKRK